MKIQGILRKFRERFENSGNVLKIRGTVENSSNVRTCITSASGSLPLDAASSSPATDASLVPLSPRVPAGSPLGLVSLAAASSVDSGTSAPIEGLSAKQ